MSPAPAAFLALRLTAESSSAPRCETCGAPLPVDPLAARVRCEHCGGEREVDAALRDAMSAYVGDVRAFVRAELEARFHTAFFAQSEAMGVPVVAGTLAIALGLVFGVGAWFVAREGYLFVSHLVLLSVIWLPGVGAFTRGWWGMFVFPSPAALVRLSVARCAACGAMQAFAAGAAHAACSHCRATLLVPTAVAEHLLRETHALSVASQTTRDITQGEVQRRLDERLVGPSVAAVFIGVPVVGGLAVWLAFQGGTAVAPPFVAALLIAPFVFAAPFLILAPVRAGQHRERLDSLAAELCTRGPQR